MSIYVTGGAEQDERYEGRDAHDLRGHLLHVERQRDEAVALLRGVLKRADLFPDDEARIYAFLAKVKP